MSVRVRFAPSPTGSLHVGNVRTALYNWLFARQSRGAFILRVEDTDRSRSERRYEEQLRKDLSWLGLDWDEGVDVGGSYGPYRQTDRFDLYRQQAQRLLDAGAAYYCFCTSEELEIERGRMKAEGRQPVYSGKCRAIVLEEACRRVETGQSATVRLKVGKGKVKFEDLIFGPIQVDTSVIGDFILQRSDGSPQYNFAVVIDDLCMKITHVIRGDGHLSNTPKQLLVYEALGASPPTFAHLSTILGKDGAKLSKRHGAVSMGDFRRRGYLPEALVNYLALLGWTPRQEGCEILSRDELVAEFELFRVHRQAATFDPDKLDWVNRSHMKRADPDRLVEMALPYLERENWVDPNPCPDVRLWLRTVVETLLKYMNKLEDLPDAARLIFEFEPSRDLRYPDVRETLAEKETREVIEAFFNEIQGRDQLDQETFKEAVDRTKEATGRKGKQLFHPIRMALTARSSGPALDALVSILEKGKSLDLPVRVLGVRERVDAVRRELES